MLVFRVDELLIFWVDTGRAHIERAAHNLLLNEDGGHTMAWKEG